MGSANIRVGKFFDLDALFGFIMMVFFILTFVSSFRLENASAFMLPRLLSGLGTIIVAAVLLRKYREIIKCEEVRDLAKESETGSDSRGVHLLVTFIYTAIYIVATPYLGFFLSTVIAIWGFGFIMRSRNRVATFVTGLIVPVFLYLFFERLLHVGLPAGLLRSILPY